MFSINTNYTMNINYENNLVKMFVFKYSQIDIIIRKIKKNRGKSNIMNSYSDNFNYNFKKLTDYKYEASKQIENKKTNTECFIDLLNSRVTIFNNIFSLKYCIYLLFMGLKEENRNVGQVLLTSY